MSLEKTHGRRDLSLKLGLVDFMLLFSPLAYVDPVHCNMAHLFVELLKDSLNEYAYAAEIAGVNYKLENTMYGIYVSDCLSILREAEGCQICCLKSGANHVPRAHLSFGQRLDSELWNNQFQSPTF